MSYRLKAGALRRDRTVLLEKPGPEIAIAEGPTPASGVFLGVRAKTAKPLLRLSLGRVTTMRRFSACHREEAFWMRPAMGSQHRQIPAETQFLLIERTDRTYVLLAPLFGEVLRFSLLGRADHLELVGETGDPLVAASEDLALYLTHGKDPYALVAAGARDVAARLGARLREEKPLPDFANGFGWCTWDAFYQDVSEAGVRAGLEGFRAAGLTPRFMILDDGWQHVTTSPTGEKRLASFGTDTAKFPEGLGTVTAMARSEFGLKHFLVWHALVGTWGGVECEAFAAYAARDAWRNYGPGILTHTPNANVEWWGQRAGLIPAGTVARFYDDYHASLAAAGVDGVKVDNQAVLEALAAGTGGRVPLTRAYRQALEASTQRHFDGRLINCMSNATETHLLARDSTLLRTSIDFWPQKPGTHGLHLFINAQVCLWFGEFIHGDWDMFHSSHPWGAFHAAARAVSGSPVYVSDKPAQHDVGLLRKLVLPDGSVARCDALGRPSPDCLFRDVTREDVPLKIFNRNGPAAVVGVFHCRHVPSTDAQPTSPTLKTRVSRADVPGLPGGRFALHGHTTGRLVVARPGRDASLPVSLGPGGWEVVTLAPVERDVAVIGLANLLNSGGAVTSRGWRDRKSYGVTLRAGGRLLAWSKRTPESVTANGASMPFTFKRGRLEILLPAVAGPLNVELRFD